MMIALSGLMVMASIMVLTGDPMFTRDAAELCITAFLGAGAAGFASFWCFGHERRRGYLLALLGGVGATIIGAFLAGLMYFGLFEQEGLVDTLSISLLAAFFIMSMIVTTPVGIVWVASMLGTHVITQQLRRRDQV